MPLTGEQHSTYKDAARKVLGSIKLPMPEEYSALSPGRMALTGGNMRDRRNGLHKKRGQYFKAANAILDNAGGRELNHEEAMAYDFMLDTIESINAELDQVYQKAVDIIDKEGNKIRYYTPDQKIAGDVTQSGHEDFSIADYVKANMGLPISAMSATPIVRGPAVVPEFLSAQIIDDVRSKSRVVQAGAISIPIRGKTTIAKITGDPTVYQHTEAQEDIQKSKPTLSPVELDPKILVAQVLLTEELVQDSTNIDQALRMSLAAAFSQKLDGLSLATLLADSDITEGNEDLSGWAGVLTAVGAMLAANMELPRSWIGADTDYIARAGQLASTAGSWLGRPPVLDGMMDLETTKLETDQAVAGDFSGFAIATRYDMRLEVIRWKEEAKATHLLVAHARMDGFVVQPKLLYRNVPDSE